MWPKHVAAAAAEIKGILNIRQTLLVFKMYFSVFYIKVVAL
jgi:hypothetical protein